MDLQPGYSPDGGGMMVTDNLDNGLPAVDPATAMLEKKVAELSAAVSARDAFLAVAAHELRNPMTPILAHVQRLSRIAAAGGADAEVSKGLQRLEKLVEHYIRRATALLEVSRMTTGKLTLNHEPFDLADQVRETVDTIRPSAAYAGSTLTVQAPDRLAVRIDRMAIEQILDNLISNAVKYGQGRPVAVTLTAAGDAATIEVRDRGNGISVADQARIFDRFERAVTPGSTVGGFGVGLWVVGQLVEALGAEISVQSVVGEGTTFAVRLPIGAIEPT
jgi:signal transduction histidine kinase